MVRSGQNLSHRTRGKCARKEFSFHVQDYYVYRMKRLLTILAVITICFLSSNAFGQDWIRVGISKSGDTFYVRSFEGPPGPENTKVAWEKIVSKNTTYFKNTRSMKKKKTYGYTIHKIECDCSNKRRKIWSVSVYKIDGTALQTTQFEPESEKWLDVVPETTGGVVLKAVCEHF